MTDESLMTEIIKQYGSSKIYQADANKLKEKYAFSLQMIEELEKELQ